MGEVSTIGLDIAKSIFQIHGVDADGRPAPAATLPANSPRVPTPTATRSTTPRYRMRQVAISIARSATTRSLTSPPSR
jgi:hypothetical protein